MEKHNQMKFIAAFFFVLLFNCSQSETNIDYRPDFKKYFDNYGVEGSFLIYDLNENKFTGYNQERLQQAFLPASTFKIFNSLVALETEVIPDENEIFKWDGTEYQVKNWNRDHNLRSAIKYSAVWFYQELARRIGQNRMQHYIDLVEYGNQNISGGIDNFWLDGGLRISSFEQISFLKKLYKNDLPFTQQNINIVKDILIIEKTENYTLRAKTGWTQQIGWFVGYLEQDNNIYFFATNINILNSEEAKARESVTRDVLNALELL